jgi:hypothetical protein
LSDVLLRVDGCPERKLHQSRRVGEAEIVAPLPNDGICTTPSGASRLRGTSAFALVMQMQKHWAAEARMEHARFSRAASPCKTSGGLGATETHGSSRLPQALTFFLQPAPNLRPKLAADLGQGHAGVTSMQGPSASGSQLSRANESLSVECPGR